MLGPEGNARRRGKQSYAGAVASLSDAGQSPQRAETVSIPPFYKSLTALLEITLEHWHRFFFLPVPVPSDGVIEMCHRDGRRSVLSRNVAKSYPRPSRVLWIKAQERHKNIKRRPRVDLLLTHTVVRTHNHRLALLQSLHNLRMPSQQCIQAKCKETKKGVLSYCLLCMAVLEE